MPGSPTTPAKRVVAAAAAPAKAAPAKATPQVDRTKGAHSGVKKDHLAKKGTGIDPRLQNFAGNAKVIRRPTDDPQYVPSSRLLSMFSYICTSAPETHAAPVAEAVEAHEADDHATEEHGDDAVDHDEHAHDESELVHEEGEEGGDVEHGDHTGDDHEADDHHVDDEESEHHEEEPAPAPAPAPAKPLNLPEDWVEKAKRQSCSEMRHS